MPTAMRLHAILHLAMRLHVILRHVMLHRVMLRLVMDRHKKTKIKHKSTKIKRVDISVIPLNFLSENKK
jgi:hypothetical protein